MVNSKLKWLEDWFHPRSWYVTSVGNWLETSCERRNLTLVSCEFTHFVKVFFWTSSLSSAGTRDKKHTKKKSGKEEEQQRVGWGNTRSQVKREVQPRIKRNMKRATGFTLMRTHTHCSFMSQYRPVAPRSLFLSPSHSIKKKKNENRKARVVLSVERGALLISLAANCFLIASISASSAALDSAGFRKWQLGKH